LHQIIKSASFFNGYGLTETAVSVFLYEISLDKNIYPFGIPLGHPMPKGSYFIIDENENKINDGEIGELVIYGPNLMSGYWNKQETTKKVLKKFINLNQNEDGFRTGDLVKEIDGQIYFNGRKDCQVKILGYRIELGEIEAIISGINGVRECCVKAEEGKNKKKIISFLSINDIELSGIKAASKEKLPDYMMPSEWIVMDELPKLSNEKIDRSKLNYVL
jgi:acyl-coenzyme A synthetase/AMP-(fatty) acid ligase